MPPHGTCPACHRQFTLTMKGTLRHHLERSIVGRQFSPPCKGAGQKPLKGQSGASEAEEAQP